MVRPYAETFLEEMAKYYELIVFTAALQDYTDFILDIIDAKKSISYKFYRQHTQSYGNSYTKVCDTFSFRNKQKNKQSAAAITILAEG